jgi:hypothetical protein
LLVCFVALAAAVDEKPDANLKTNIEVPADQLETDDWYNRHYYGHYYNPYGYYSPYGYRYKHWRGRRSAAENKPKTDQLNAADQEANEWYGRGYYYGYYNPYGYRNYNGRYGYWRSYPW